MLDSLLTPWPGEPALIGLHLDGDSISESFRHGPVNEVRAWASVSKTVASLQFALGSETDPTLGACPAGPEGSTLTHLLAHASGLGFEADSPRAPVGAKRVYSNVGIDLAVSTMTAEDPREFWGREIFAPLGISATLQGRPSSGVVGSCEDLAMIAGEWLRPRLMSEAGRDRARTVFLPEIGGVVPGYGRFEPCWWGLGVEVNGKKSHWMGDWPSLSFGHFGQSGAFMLVTVEEGIALVATSTVDFGPWAKEYFSTVTSSLREEILRS